MYEVEVLSSHGDRHLCIFIHCEFHHAVLFRRFLVAYLEGVECGGIICVGDHEGDVLRCGQRCLWGGIGIGIDHIETYVVASHHVVGCGEIEFERVGIGGVHNRGVHHCGGDPRYHCRYVVREERQHIVAVLRILRNDYNGLVGAFRNCYGINGGFAYFRCVVHTLDTE